MKRLLGILLMVALLYGGLMLLDENARSVSNQQTIANRLGFYGVLTVGVGILIIAGGIDLSIGSVVGLGAVCFALLLEQQVPPSLAAGIVLLGSALIGLIHGLLVTQLGLQPFLVTLCGLFIYRGIARSITKVSVGLDIRGAPPEFKERIEQMRQLLMGTHLGIPNQLLLLIGVSIVLALFLHGTRYGRYLFAIGANEDAARYAGIPTKRYKILAYVICSALAGLGSVLYILDNRTANATSAGSWLELYAITGAVLGGCSLRGGEGTVPGMFLGAAVLPLLRQLCSFGEISSELEYAVIGAALLLGTIADELLKRRTLGRA
ncbi:MAG TPA: ABC transporter permease [Gemmataceae bacterium]|jgi:ribose transport system permease protein